MLDYKILSTYESDIYLKSGMVNLSNSSNLSTSQQAVSIISDVECLWKLSENSQLLVTMNNPLFVSVEMNLILSKCYQLAVIQISCPCTSMTCDKSIYRNVMISTVSMYVYQCICTTNSLVNSMRNEFCLVYLLQIPKY